MGSSSASPHQSADRFSRLVEEYQRARPQPPAVIVEFLHQLTRRRKLELVVDLGCGTGVSTLPWCDRAERVIGLDLSREMVEFASRKAARPNITYVQGNSDCTGLPGGCADIVTCSSAIHWMEPRSGFHEINRILKPGGVFGAYGPQVPFLPLNAWEVCLAFHAFTAQAKARDRELCGDTRPRSYRWAEVLEFAKSQAGFRYADEFCFHSAINWTAEQFCDWVLTLSYVHHLVDSGDQQTICRFEDFKGRIQEMLGDEPTTFMQSYRLILGVR